VALRGGQRRGLLFAADALIGRSSPPSSSLAEDFNDGKSPFVTRSTDASTTAYVDGGYMVTILDPTHDLSSYMRLKTSSGISVDANVSFPGGPVTASTGAGVMALHSQTQGYMLGVWSDGSFALLKVVDWSAPPDQAVRVIASGTVPPGTDLPTTLRLTATSDAGEVTLTAWVDGKQVATETDGDGYDSFDRMGLWAWADQAGAKILFDDVAATTS
jgi:hypothetical protein